MVVLSCATPSVSRPLYRTRRCSARTTRASAGPRARGRTRREGSTCARAGMPGRGSGRVLLRRRCPREVAVAELGPRRVPPLRVARAHALRRLEDLGDVSALRRGVVERAQRLVMVGLIVVEAPDAEVASPREERERAERRDRSPPDPPDRVRGLRRVLEVGRGGAAHVRLPPTRDPGAARTRALVPPRRIGWQAAPGQLEKSRLPPYHLRGVCSGPARLRSRPLFACVAFRAPLNKFARPSRTKPGDVLSTRLS